jgi:glutamine---fructose-6-phosphate transaminase (isomerizing)
MCGIVGYIGTKAAQTVLVNGLEKLEYRGYDSAGVATIAEGQIDCIRAKGKLQNLREKLDISPSHAPMAEGRSKTIGIGHTRWATHGKPEEYNAHPHTDTARRIAVVQNGIIENYRELRDFLKAQGHEFRSDTDTEVIPHLLAECFKNGATSLLEAVQQAVQKLEGAFAIAVISADSPDELIVARQQAPLVIGLGDGEFFCASDTPALVQYTQTVVQLENEEMARLTRDGYQVYNFQGDKVRKTPRTLNWNPIAIEKQGFKHFMAKEIYEQPSVVRTCLEAYLDMNWTANSGHSPIKLDLPESIYQDLEHIQIVACGTSLHAGMVGRHLLENLAQIPTFIQYASEFRYAPPPVMANTLTIGITQSGETADTLAAIEIEQLRRSKLEPKFQSRLMAVTNRTDSAIARLVGTVIDTHAGMEIGVAATKTFMGQLMAFYFLALEIAYRRQTISLERIQELVDGLKKLPSQIEIILESQEKYIEELSHSFLETQDVIFLGRGINFPIALEGALKLKEISYIHAEGYPSGEMKHGPIALLDAKVPVVAIAMPGSVYEKAISNAQEAKARDSHLYGVVAAGDKDASEIFDKVLPVPNVEELLSPVLTVIPMQLISYHIAAMRGLDVDQPRNLAKSVTVE